MELSRVTLENVVAALAKETVESDLILLTDCDCEKTQAYVNGRLPEYFSTPRDCARSWASYILNRDTENIGTLYWGTHFRKAHVLHIRNRYGLYTTAGLPFGYPSGYPTPAKQ